MSKRCCANCAWCQSNWKGNRIQGTSCYDPNHDMTKLNYDCLGYGSRNKYKHWLEVTPDTKCDSGKPDGSKVAGSGTKYDQGKPDLSLVPRSFLDEVARALMFGEQKYSRYNYRAGFAAHRLVAACLRHITAWMWVEDVDPESGISHLAHAGACLAMLVDIRDLGTLQDDRPEQVRKPREPRSGEESRE